VPSPDGSGNPFLQLFQGLKPWKSCKKDYSGQPEQLQKKSKNQIPEFNHLIFAYFSGFKFKTCE
jgi:hypothetical protein